MQDTKLRRKDKQKGEAPCSPGGFLPQLFHLGLEPLVGLRQCSHLLPVELQSLHRREKTGEHSPVSSQPARAHSRPTGRFRAASSTWALKTLTAVPSYKWQLQRDPVSQAAVSERGRECWEGLPPRGAPAPGGVTVNGFRGLGLLLAPLAALSTPVRTRVLTAAGVPYPAPGSCSSTCTHLAPTPSVLKSLTLPASSQSAHLALSWTLKNLPSNCLDLTCPPFLISGIAPQTQQDSELRPRSPALR